MKRVLKCCSKLLTLMGLVLLTSACSRSITWEEEVRLNTGETIWLERTMPWNLQGGFGNPFDIGMRPDVDRQVLRFKYRNREYVYSGGAAIRWIAISNQQTPVLLATPDDWAWAVKNDFFCVVPFYVQFVPDATGRNWSWVRPIEPWLHGLPYNVMGNFPRLDETVRRRYTVADRESRDAVRRVQYPESLVILERYTSQSCIADPTVASKVPSQGSR